MKDRFETLLPDCEVEKLLSPLSIVCAEEIGADRGLLSHVLWSGRYGKVVWTEHHRGVKRFGIAAVPAVLLAEKELILGAVSREVYKKSIDRLLAEGEKGNSS